MHANHLAGMMRLLGLGVGIFIFAACGSADVLTLADVANTTPTPVAEELDSDETTADVDATDATTANPDAASSGGTASTTATGGTTDTTDRTGGETNSSSAAGGATNATAAGANTTTGGAVASFESGKASQLTDTTTTASSKTTSTSDQQSTAIDDSIVYIETSECGWTQTGTGVIVGDGLVLTASHIVAEADTIRVHAGGTSYEAWDQGQDYDSDLALLRTVEPIPGKPLEFGPAASVGDEAVLLQYTSANDLTVTPTSIVDVARDNPRVNAVIFFDTIAEASDSGGPVVNSDGKIIGIINRSRPYDDVVDHAIDGATANQHVQENSHWEGQPPITECEELPLSEHEKVQVRADHRRVQQLEWTFDAYLYDVNNGHPEEAWDRFSPSLQDSIGGFDTFAEGTDTSHIGKFVITSIDETLTGFTVGATFMTTQDASDGPNGWTCARWTMQYGIIEDSDSQFLIDSAQNLTDSPAPCE